MKKEVKRYVKFLSPGSFTANEWTKELAVLDPASVIWPDNAYAFSLHEREDIVDGGKRYTGKTLQIGPLYYHPDSLVQTLDEVRLNPNASTILISNMECNKWDRIIWSRWSNWPQPYDPAKMMVQP